MTGDNKQNQTSTAGGPSSRDVPDVEVDMGSPLNILGTDVMVSAADFKVEHAPGFGLSLFKALPPLPVPDEDEGQDTQPTQDAPLPKGRNFQCSSSLFCLLLSRVEEPEKPSFPAHRRENSSKEGNSSAVVKSQTWYKRLSWGRYT